jgi:hypothetical protein
LEKVKRKAFYFFLFCAKKKMNGCQEGDYSGKGVLSKNAEEPWNDKREKVE